MKDVTGTQNTPTDVIFGPQSLEAISKTLLSSSTDLSEQGLALIKKYPLHSAMVAGAVGFLLGAIISRK